MKPSNKYNLVTISARQCWDAEAFSLTEPVTTEPVYTGSILLGLELQQMGGNRRNCGLELVLGKGQHQ